MQRISLLNIAHDTLKKHIQTNDIVIDATVGNGHDTLFLANQIGPQGKLFGFDIQQSAIDSTLAKFQSLPFTQNLRLFHASHESIKEKIPAEYHCKISAIMFNLGYLPGGDKSIITSAPSTIKALNAACAIIADKGIITVTAYPGHKGGDLETIEIANWHEQLNKSQFQTNIINSSMNTQTAPILFIIQKQSNHH